MRLTEDDLYRQSTQYKHWSFTPADLRRLRQKTNAHAAAQVKLHIAQDGAERAKLGGLDVASAPDSGADTPNGNGNGNGAGAGAGAGVGTGANTPVPGGEVDCLTMDEEKMVVDKFCETAMKLGDFLKLQPDVTVRAAPPPAKDAQLTLRGPRPSSSCAASTSTTRP
jgi:cyclin H